MRLFASSSSFNVRVPLPLLVLSAATLSTALLVAPNSNCAVQCGNVLSSLSGSDLTCDDSLYKSTIQGQTFQSCIACELNSTYVDPVTNQTDLQWLLYNLRYTVSFCLFGYPNNTNIANSPCITSFACGQIQNATESYLSTDGETTYGYCDKWATDRLPKCQQCLADSSNVHYISNYITALTAGCQYRPSVGHALSSALQGTVFSSTPVNITDPAATTNLPAFRPDNGRFPLATRIGIAVGGIVFLAVVAGCCIVWRGKRRRRAYLARHAPSRLTTDMPRFHDKGGMGVDGSPSTASPQNESAKGLIGYRPWGSGQFHEDSPISSSGGYFGQQGIGSGMEKTQFSPYSSPISPEDATAGRSREWPMPAAIGRAVSPTGREDAIEMAQLPKDERERIDREAWAAHSGFSTDGAAPIIRAPMPVKGAVGMGNVF